MQILVTYSNFCIPPFFMFIIPYYIIRYGAENYLKHVLHEYFYKIITAFLLFDIFFFVLFSVLNHHIKWLN